MILLLEIGLTIVAWNRGWRGWALLPMVLGYTGAFVVGLFMGAMGFIDEAAIFGVGIVFEVLSIGTLVVMVFRPRRTTEPQQAISSIIGPTMPESENPASESQVAHWMS